MRRVALTLALSPAPTACTVIVVQDNPDLGSSSGDDTTSTGPSPDDTSTGGPDLDSTGEDSSSSLATGSGESTGGSSTGEPLAPSGAACVDGAACESGACDPFGTCAPACPCGDAAAACVADACVAVGVDGEGAEGLAINESPAGSIGAEDPADVWGVQLTTPGTYGIMISGVGATAYVVDGAGQVVATPDDASMVGDKVSQRSFTIASADEPVTVIIVAPDLAASTDYYFWIITP